MNIARYDNTKPGAKSLIAWVYETKRILDYDIHKISTAFTKGPKLWNNLPKSVKNATSLKSFKNDISSFLQGV